MPKYGPDVAVLISTETGHVIMPGARVKDFRHEEREFKFISRLPGDGSSGRIIISASVGGEVFPSVLNAKIIVLADAGPRWKVTKDDTEIGRAEQWGNDRHVLNMDNPKTAGDWYWRALDAGWSRTGSLELRESERGIWEVHAIPEPYTHGQGYTHKDTGIRVIDTWLHSTT
ncbi:hypothetical protein [Streptomyces sp. NPDC017448]|uniref:hypothetical protein n=1 Tax=Streptomyces sp. NPDC017448 TaxID=3364996 RepID=UPI00379A7E73